LRPGGAPSGAPDGTRGLKNIYILINSLIKL
jgi:hypothetical protein